MTASPSPPPDPQPNGGVGSILWTLFLGSALVMLAAAPKRSRGRESLESEPRPTTGGGARSYSGRAAEIVAATQVDRGRAARNPAEITSSGWKDIAVRVYLEFNKD